MASEGESSASPLKTTGLELKNLLEKTGRTIRDINGMDKLDLLNLIVEQIKEKVGSRGRMDLRCSDLNTLLKKEGLPAQSTARGAIQQLLKLRCSQLARLGTYSVLPLKSTSEADDAFTLALMVMPSNEVDSCFGCDDVAASTGGPARDTAFTFDFVAYSRDQCGSTENKTRADFGRTSVGSVSLEEQLKQSAEQLRRSSGSMTTTPSGSMTVAPHSPRGVPLKSSGHGLRQILEKTGHTLRGLGILEKFELLDLVVEQIKDKIQVGQKMNLTLSELQAMLELEGLPPGENARRAVQQLLELRRIQLVRLGSYTRPKSTADSRAIINAGANFSIHLEEIPIEDVQACFASEHRADRLPSSENMQSDSKGSSELNFTGKISPDSAAFPSMAPSFSYADLEAKVLELTSKLDKAETRASLAELQTKVTKLQAALEKEKARADLMEGRAELAERRADALEARNAVLEGRDVPRKLASPRATSRELRTSREAPLTRDSRSLGSYETPPATRTRGQDKSPPPGARKAPLESLAPKVRAKPPLPEAAGGKGIASLPCPKRHAGVPGRPLFVSF